jgi:hypothetical protein
MFHARRIFAVAPVKHLWQRLVIETRRDPMEKLQLIKYDKYAYQVVDDNGKVVATIEALANDFWAVRKNGKRIDRRVYATPKKAFAAFKAEAV